MSTRMKNGEISDGARDKLKKTYYTEGKTYGRDALFEYLKSKYPSTQ